jgi:hypothetical protein
LADTTKQIHDYAPFITPSGLFWTMPLHPNSVQVQFNSARASMHVDGLSIPDTHDLANSLTGGKGFAGMGIPPIAPVPSTSSGSARSAGRPSSMRRKTSEAISSRRVPQLSGRPYKMGSSLIRRNPIRRATSAPRLAASVTASSLAKRTTTRITRNAAPTNIGAAFQCAIETGARIILLTLRSRLLLFYSFWKITSSRSLNAESSTSASESHT